MALAVNRASYLADLDCILAQLGLTITGSKHPHINA